MNSKVKHERSNLKIDALIICLTLSLLNTSVHGEISKNEKFELKYVKMMLNLINFHDFAIIENI